MSDQTTNEENAPEETWVEPVEIKPLVIKPLELAEENVEEYAQQIAAERAQVAQAQLVMPWREGSKRPSGPSRMSLESLFARFSACFRCCYFLAGYRNLHGADVLEKAIAEGNDPDWIVVPFTHTERELLHKSFGIQTDVHFYYFEGSCDNCRRAYVLQAALDEGESAVLKIKL